MSFRFRLGPLTFGRTGTRISLWRRGSGVSIPLSGKGRTFAKVRFGPASWYGNWSHRKKGAKAVAWLLFIGTIVGIFLLFV